MSGDLYVGMVGPGAAISIRVNAPSGVDLTAVTTRALSVSFGASTVTDWSFSLISADVMTATHIPDGLFSRSGPIDIKPTLTLDGVPYRYKQPPWRESPRLRICDRRRLAQFVGSRHGSSSGLCVQPDRGSRESSAERSTPTRSFRHRERLDGHSDPRCVRASS